MATYEYRCRCSAVLRAVAKSMAEAGRAETCPGCGAVMRRVWTVPNTIVRPWGFHLRPGERGYNNFNRMLENGHVPTPDANSHLGAGAPSDAELEAEEYAGVPFVVDEDGMQKVHEVARAAFSESGSRL